MKSFKVMKSFLWEVIYVHFYNWDRSLDLVLVVYDLIELIIETSLWTKDYSMFDSHTQHKSLMFNECLFHLYVFKCDMCVFNHMWIKSKRFLFFLFAFGSDLYHPYFSKFFKLFLCEKHVFLGVIVTYFMCKLNRKLEGSILKFFNFGQRVLWLFRE